MASSEGFRDIDRFLGDVEDETTCGGVGDGTVIWRILLGTALTVVLALGTLACRSQRTGGMARF